MITWSFYLIFANSEASLSRELMLPKLSSNCFLFNGERASKVCLRDRCKEVGVGGYY